MTQQDIDALAREIAECRWAFISSTKQGQELAREYSNFCRIVVANVAYAQDKNFDQDQFYASIESFSKLISTKRSKGKPRP